MGLAEGRQRFPVCLSSALEMQNDEATFCSDRRGFPKLDARSVHRKLSASVHADDLLDQRIGRLFYASGYLLDQHGLVRSVFATTLTEDVGQLVLCGVLTWLDLLLGQLLRQ